MHPIVIEYVCSRNVTRSPTFEAVTKWYAKQHGLEDRIIAIATGLDVDRLNRGELTDKEAEFYLKMFKDVETTLHAFSSLSEEAQAALLSNNYERKRYAAFGAMISIDTLCVIMRNSALDHRDINPANCGWQQQTTSRDDVHLVIATAEKYVIRLQSIYAQKNKVTLPVSKFGPEPVPFGFELKDFVAIVDSALHSVPLIVEYSLKMFS